MLSIPEIIEGSYKEGIEIEWEIWNAEGKVILSIYRSSIQPYWLEAAETYILREIETRYPWIEVRFSDY